MRFKIFSILLTALVVVSAAYAPTVIGSGGGTLFEFLGVVEALPSGGLVGAWRVGGRIVTVSAATEVNQLVAPARIGATVRVRGDLKADGSVDAKSVEVKSPADDNGGATGVRFTGVVERIPSGGFAGDWTVGGRTVHASAATRVIQTDGTVGVGATVEVHGNERADRSVDAEEIEVRSGVSGGGGAEDAHLFGLVESLPGGGSLVGDWRVGGRTLHVSSSTLLNAEGSVFSVGAYVEAQGSQRADGSVDATKVELRRSAPPADASPESFRGAVESLSSAPGWIGDWRVGGRLVHVSAKTSIDQEHGAVAPGALVEVHGTTLIDGSVAAARIEVEWGPASTGTVRSNSWLLPSSARAQGRSGSYYTTDLTIANTGAAAASVTLKFLGHDRDGRTGPERTLAIPAGTTALVRDVLGNLFDLSDDYGAVLVSANVATLIVESSTSTPGGGGTFGQGLRATERNDLAGDDRARSMSGVKDDGASRTNLVLASLSEQPIDVDVNLFGADGSPLGSRRVRLEPLGMTQLSNVSPTLGATGPVAGGRLVVSSPTAGGAFAAYATVIDNATNDPRAIPAR